MALGADAAAEDAQRAGMYVAQIVLDSGGQYCATLRRLRDQPFMTNRSRTLYVRRGKGRTIEAAIRNAMLDDFADILG
jgi:hypothetical protein